MIQENILKAKKLIEQADAGMGVDRFSLRYGLLEGISAFKKLGLNF